MSSLAALHFSLAKCYINSCKVSIQQKSQLKIIWDFFFNILMFFYYYSNRMFRQNIALNLLQYLLVNYRWYWGNGHSQRAYDWAKLKCRMSHQLFWSVLPEENVKCVSDNQLLEVLQHIDKHRWPTNKSSFGFIKSLRTQSELQMFLFSDSRGKSAGWLIVQWGKCLGVCARSDLTADMNTAVMACVSR